MAGEETGAAHSFQAGCPVDAAYKACAAALASVPGVSVNAADKASYTIDISVRASLWTRGEDIRLVLTPSGEAETLVCIFSETQSKAPGAAKHRCSYDDLECAVRWQLSRPPG
jgi:hypothetical protein